MEKSGIQKEYTKAEKIYYSQNDTYFFFENVLRTKVPGYDMAMTSQQKEGCAAFDKLLNVKRKKQHYQENQLEAYQLTLDEIELEKKVGVSAQSGKATGKTTWLAGIALKFLYCYEESIVLVGSNSIDQLKRTIWAEMGRLLAQSTIKDDIVLKSEKAYHAFPTQKEEQQVSQYCFISQIATNTGGSGDQATKLAGLHAKNMLIIVDEATGQENDSVFEQLITTMTDIVNLMVVAYNPNTDRGFAIESQRKNQHMFECLLWDAEESELVKKSHIENLAITYGRDSNIFRTYVKGLVPLTATDALLPWGWIQEGANKEAAVYKGAPKVMGVDPSDGGDACGFYIREGDRGLACFEKNFNDTVELEEFCVSEAYQWELDVIVIETDGLGGPIYNNLKRSKVGNIVRSFKTTRKAKNQTYKTQRDEVFMKIKEKYRTGTISTPNDPELMNQLGFMKTNTDTKKGQVKVIGKKDYKIKYHKSPNKLDAMVPAYSVNDYYYQDSTLGQDKIENNPHVRQGKEKSEGQKNGWLTQ